MPLTTTKAAAITMRVEGLVIPEGATLVKRVLLEEEHDFSPSGSISA